MLDNYSKREKTLVMIVGSLVPVFLVYLCINSFTNSYFEKRSQKNRLQSSVNLELEKQLEGQNASQRRQYYRTISMPISDTDSSHNTHADQYKTWLQSVAKQIGMTGTSAKPLASRPGIYQGNGKSELVFDAYPITLRAVCTLDQLQEFLYQFYKADLLHRVNSLRITPKAAGTTASASKTRSGKFGIEIKIESISMVDAESTGEFLNEFLKPEFGLEHFTQKISSRNIFGPANNPPIASVRDKQIEFGKKIDIRISAQEIDKNQRLTFELIEPMHGATIKQLSPTMKSATVNIADPLEVGEYGPFKVKITDDGMPQKSTIAEFKVIVTPEKVAKKTEPKPEFKHASETRITAVLRDRLGDWRVWIHVQTLGAKYKLKIGEKFHLDGSDWIIHDITSPKNVVLKRENQLLTFCNGCSLASPSSTVDLKATASVTSSK